MRKPRAAARVGEINIFLATGSAASRDWITVPDNGAAVLLAQTPNAVQFIIRQRVVSVGQVVHGIVEPLLLVVDGSLQNPATEDMAEKLVPGLFEYAGGCFGAVSGFPTGHSNVISSR